MLYADLRLFSSSSLSSSLFLFTNLGLFSSLMLSSMFLFSSVMLSSNPKLSSSLMLYILSLAPELLSNLDEGIAYSRWHHPRWRAYSRTIRASLDAAFDRNGPFVGPLCDGFGRLFGMVWDVFGVC